MKMVSLCGLYLTFVGLALLTSSAVQAARTNQMLSRSLS